MMAGLQGPVKLTFAGKLANHLIKTENGAAFDDRRGRVPSSSDRSAKVLGQQLDVPVFDMGTDVSPVEIVRQGMALAREKKK